MKKKLILSMLMASLVLSSSGNIWAVSQNGTVDNSGFETIPQEDEDTTFEDVPVVDGQNTTGTSTEVTTPTVIEKKEEVKVESNIRVINTQLPVQLKKALRYDKYLMSYDYGISLSSGIPIYQSPVWGSKVVYKMGTYQKVGLMEEIKGPANNRGNNLWYKVTYMDKNVAKAGYVSPQSIEIRSFQWQKMLENMNRLRDVAAWGELAHVANYKNRVGLPPALKGDIDQYGHRRSEAAPLYDQPNTKSGFRYLPDGSLVKIMGQENGMYKVMIPGSKDHKYIPTKYLNSGPKFTSLSKIIVVDRKNQNEATFEVTSQGYNLTSYTLATTGKVGTYSRETPLGYFMAQEKKGKMMYLKDGTTEIEGYAPYATRFTGGGYVHGVPVAFKGKDKKDPGIVEFSTTMGTTPRSHMCVRNYTSHAKFVYDWAEIGKTAVIVIE